MDNWLVSNSIHYLIEIGQWMLKNCITVSNECICLFGGLFFPLHFHLVCLSKPNKKKCWYYWSAQFDEQSVVIHRNISIECIFKRMHINSHEWTSVTFLWVGFALYVYCILNRIHAWKHKITMQLYDII